MVKCNAIFEGNIMNLNKKQIAHLRSLAHSLNPVVMIGNNGLTENVMKEIDMNLSAHELIKIKVSGDDREARKAMYLEICEQNNATAIHHVGKQLVIYRVSDKQKIEIPAK